MAPPVTGLVRPVRLDSLGVTGPTKAQAEGPHWLRTSHGWHVRAGAPRHLVEQRIVEAAVRLPVSGAVTGWAACRLLGAAYFDGVDRAGALLPVPLAIGPHRSIGTSAQVRPTNHVPLPRDRTVAYGLPVVTPQRATYDAVRLCPDLREGVRVVDMMAAAGLCSLAMLREYAEEQPQDAWKVRRVLELASEHSWSPIETDLRLVCRLDVGIDDIVPNANIHDSRGLVVATADLLDVRAGAAFEADGEHHARAMQAAADNRRTDVLLTLGIEVGRFTASEAARPTLAAHRIRLIRSRSRFESEDDRGWYFTPRPDTLDARLRRDPSEHEPGA